MGQKRMSPTGKSALQRVKWERGTRLERAWIEYLAPRGGKTPTDQWLSRKSGKPGDPEVTDSALFNRTALSIPGESPKPTVPAEIPAWLPWTLPLRSKAWIQNRGNKRNPHPGAGPQEPRAEHNPPVRLRMVPEGPTLFLMTFCGTPGVEGWSWSVAIRRSLNFE